MAAYADYTYYTNTFLGTAIASSNFLRLATLASSMIDAMTFDRAAVETDTAKIDKIKMATCAVAEEIQAIETEGGVTGIQSESVGNTSVAYSPNSPKLFSYKARLREKAKAYLGTS